MAIYLGATQISSNPTGTGKLILGTQNICKAYLGSTLIFDNCAIPNTNVQLQYLGSYGGAYGYTASENPPDNYTISGQPNVTGTLTLSTPTYDSTLYTPTSAGAPDVNPKSVPYTFPTSGTSIVNSTRSGGLQSIITNITQSINVTKASPVSGTFTDSPTSCTGVPNSGGCHVKVTFTGATGFTYSNLQLTEVGTSNSISLTVGVEGTLNFTLGSVDGATRNFEITGTQQAISYDYDFNISENLSGAGSSASYTVTGGNNQYNNQPLSGSVTITTVGYYGDAVSASVVATLSSGYQWSSAPSPNPDTHGISPGATFGDGGSPVTLNVTGTSQATPPSSVTMVTDGGLPFSTRTAACTGSSGPDTATAYYTGSSVDGATLYSNSSLTGYFDSGWFYDSTNGEVGQNGWGGSGGSWSSDGGC